jgi:hypothetical protein
MMFTVPVASAEKFQLKNKNRDIASPCVFAGAKVCQLKMGTMARIDLTIDGKGKAVQRSYL